MPRPISFAQAQFRHDMGFRLGPADPPFDWFEDAPEAWAKAEREEFEARIGDDLSGDAETDGIAGYHYPQEQALYQMIARYLKAARDAQHDPAAVGAEFLALIATYREHIYADLLDRDAIEARCEENTGSGDD